MRAGLAAAFRRMYSKQKSNKVCKSKTKAKAKAKAENGST
jgi:hypothetical protein